MKSNKEKDQRISKDEYRSTDIYLSAFILAGGFADLIRVEPSGARRKIFVFSSCPSQDIIQSFYNKGEESRIFALDVLEALANLKDVIHNPEKITSINGGVANV